MNAQTIADNADMIVAGYAFKVFDNYTEVTDLSDLAKTSVIQNDEIVESVMSDEELTEASSAKFFVRSDGSSKLTAKGRLKDREITAIQKFIKDNYETMYATWRTLSTNGFYENK